MDKHLQQFREVFFEEAREHLETLESGLLSLEAGGDADAETLNSIFRSAHTIKGGSGMFGLDDTARFTHSLENLLDQVRAGKISVTRPLVDILLRSCDVLRGLLNAAQQGGGLPASMESVLVELQQANTTESNSRAACVESSNAESSKAESGDVPAPQNPAPESPGNARCRWRIRFQPAPDVLRRGLNPLLALREMAELGRISDLHMDTSAVPPLAEMDAETSYIAWTLQLESDRPEARIREIFEFLHDGDGLALSLESPMESRMKQPAQPAARATAASPVPGDPGPARFIHEPQRMQETQQQENRPVPPAASEAPSASVAAGESASTIRVDVELLDRLMNQVGELVLARNQILQCAGNTDDAALGAASQRLNLITSELQEGVMKTRMQPIGVAWSMMPRLVRDLSRSCGKRIELEMQGAETELDRTIIEAIRDPLTHLVRNSCDHGLETPQQREAQGKPAAGKLHLGAFHEGGHVIIEITDDGAGIDIGRVKSKALERGLITPDQATRMSDREVIQLIYYPGFSTAERISGISGRGVGMDVVKTNIERAGGTIDVTSRRGEGTAVHIKIPLTLAIIPGMVVEGGGERFVIPQVSLMELVRLEEEHVGERIERIHDAPVCRLRGKLLPLVYLNEILKLDPVATSGAEGRDQSVNIVVLQAEDRQFGLVVDGIRDTQEIVVKPLGKHLKGLAAYSGATVMGDGRVVLILDVLGVARLAGLATSQYAAEARAAAAAAGSEAESRTSERQALLLFRSPGFERMAVPLSLVSRLEEFPGSRVEQSGGRPVVQYRDRILPLVSLQSLDGASLDRASMEGMSFDRTPAGTGDAAHDPLQVIVFLDGGCGLGLVVGEILDIIEESVQVRKKAHRRGLLGSAVVGGQVTDFLDLQTVIEACGEGWPRGARNQTATVLVADASGFNRAMIRSSIEMAGHHVVEAANATEAVAKMSRYRIDLMALSADLAADREQAAGGGSLIAILRKHAGRDVPVLPPGVNGAGDYGQMASSIDDLLARV
jgi:two-component system, chemotaxis family, sensor kinase CheA